MLYDKKMPSLADKIEADAEAKFKALKQKEKAKKSGGSRPAKVKKSKKK